MKRILFFVHYNKYNALADYVLYMLEHIKHIYTRIVFISNSPLSTEHQQKLSGLYHSLIIRENKGFDFGAWKDALLQEGWDNLSQYDNVTLMNDTCFGPLFDLEKSYIDMEQRNIDFWGISYHKKFKRGMPITDEPIPEHIQCYFMCFNNAVIRSIVFQKFWGCSECQDDPSKIYRLYKAQLTPILYNDGFKYYTIEQNINSSIKTNNLSFSNPDILIKNKTPFVRVKSLINFIYPKYIIDLIQEETDYPSNLIFDYITEMFDPNLSLQICDKQIPIIPTEKQCNTLKIAIHLHIFYPEIFEKYLNQLNKITIDFDLYITTDTDIKKNQIETLLKNSQTEKKLKIIVVCENRGRDILPLFNLSDTLNQYDVVGHFHTKKTPHVDEWHGITWLQDIFNLLLIPINRIMVEFGNNPKLGIIIPDIPIYWQLNPILQSIKYNRRFNSSLNQLWERMNTTKKIDFNKLETTIMPYGTMFWYRPMALQSLFNLHLTRDDFDAEPLPVDETLAHFIERLPVYCAWNDGFDYRIMVFSPPKVNSFINHMVISNIHKNLMELKSSNSYLVVRIILIPLKLVKKICEYVIKKFL